MKIPKVGNLVTTTVATPMEYFGYWVEPIKLFDYFKPGDIGIVTYAHQADSRYGMSGHYWCWVEYVRIPIRNILRVQLDETVIVILEDLNEQSHKD